MYLLMTVAFLCWAIVVVTLVLLVLNCGKTVRALGNLEEDKKLQDDVLKIGNMFVYGQGIVESEEKAHEILKKIGSLEEDKKVEAPYFGCCSHTTQISTCRYPDMPALKFNMVSVKSQRLHMNKLKDYYGYPIYMSQAPTKNEFLPFINALLQEKIGMVVWLSKPDEKLDAYIPMIRGTKMILGTHQLEYELCGKREEFDFYFIRIIPALKMSQVRMIRIIFVVAHCWTLAAENCHMNKHCDVVSLAQCFHDYTKHNGFPGMLVHHSAGVNLTAGFVACYIGRQVLLHKKKVNVIGICKYIKHHRHCAFTYEEKTSHKQIQVVFMVLGSLAQTFAFEDIGLLETTAKEKDLFVKAKKAAPGIKSIGIGKVSKHTTTSGSKSMTKVSKDEKKSDPKAAANVGDFTDYGSKL